MAGTMQAVYNEDDCPVFLREFLNYALSIRNLSPRTVNGYAVDLGTFFRFLRYFRKEVPQDTDFAEISISGLEFSFVRAITKAEVYEFMYYITRERGNASNTRARKLCSVKAFFRYYVNKKNLLEANPALDIDSPALKKTLPKYLSLEECLELLRSVNTEFTERDYCILTLFLNCGMRLSELVSINLTDFKEETIRIVGKGNKERTVYLTDASKDALQQYFTARAALQNLKDRNALFVSKRTGKRLTARRVEQIVEECLAAAGLAGKGYSPHKLRHTAATLMYRSGHVDMLALQEILGHANVSTTQIYTHISREQLDQAVKSSPLAGVKIKKTKDNPKAATYPTSEDGAEPDTLRGPDSDSPETEETT